MIGRWIGCHLLIDLYPSMSTLQIERDGAELWRWQRWQRWWRWWRWRRRSLFLASVQSRRRWRNRSGLLANIIPDIMCIVRKKLMRFACLQSLIGYFPAAYSSGNWCPNLLSSESLPHWLFCCCCWTFSQFGRDESRVLAIVSSCMDSSFVIHFFFLLSFFLSFFLSFQGFADDLGPFSELILGLASALHRAFGHQPFALFPA